MSRIPRNGDNAHLIEPQGYLHFFYLMNRNHIILSDSGDIQEEAPSLGMPVLEMRDTTKSTKASTTETIQLVGTGKNRIVAKSLQLLTNTATYAGITPITASMAPVDPVEEYVPFLKTKE